MLQLREIRRRKNMTMEELARRAGLSVSSISLYETGQRSPDYKVLMKLASILGCSLEELSGAYDYVSPAEELTEGDRLLFKALKGATEADKKRAAEIINALRRNYD